MSVNYATGDLFDSQWGFDVIGHGVNCKGAMGSGIAVEFKRRWPLMYNIYNGLCVQGSLLPGQVMPYKTGHGKWIYNIASQYNPGRDGNLEAIEVAMHWVDFHARSHGVAHVGLPRIGAGIAGLSWPDVCATIESVVGSSEVLYTLVSLPEA
jgi:O-acetyl-ADP-ribose deacetylase (regulator of RNase III)